MRNSVAYLINNMKEEKKPEGSVVGAIVTLVAGGALIYYCVKLFLL